MRISDELWCHPITASLPNASIGLWATALGWAALQRAEVVPPSLLDLVGATSADAEPLVEAGLWEKAEGGYRIIPWETLVPPKRRRSIPPTLRRAVYDRDDWSCVTCGATHDLTLDHVVPYSHRGPDTLENLQTMCRSCNSRKGDSCPG